MASRDYCRGCEPEADPIAEVLHLRWCTEHEPNRTGRMDHVVSQAAYLTGTAEVQGEDNKRWCDFFHRGIGKI